PRGRRRRGDDATRRSVRAAGATAATTRSWGRAAACAAVPARPRPGRRPHRSALARLRGAAETPPRPSAEPRVPKSRIAAAAAPAGHALRMHGGQEHARDLRALELIADLGRGDGQALPMVARRGCAADRAETLGCGQATIRALTRDD